MDQWYKKIMHQADDTLTPYYRLDPEELIKVIESIGLMCDGRLLALNSYENRVYQVGIEDATPLITKVYRPGRWTDEQILEEHAFAIEISDAEIPLIPPMVINRQTLHEHNGFRFALFERRGGQTVRFAQPLQLFDLVQVALEEWDHRSVVHGETITRPTSFGHAP